MTISKDTVRLVVLLPKTTRDALEKVAAQEHRSMSSYVAILIEKAILGEEGAKK